MSVQVKPQYGGTHASLNHQAKSFEATLDNIRVPFRPQFDPRRKLQQEIEVCATLLFCCSNTIHEIRLFTNNIMPLSCVRSFIHSLQSSKRKIWECIDPIERKRYFEKKKSLKMTNNSSVVVAGNEENMQQQRLNNNNETKQMIGASKAVNAAKSPFKGGDASTSNAPANNNNNSPMKQTKSASSVPKRADIEFKVNAMKVVELKRELKKHGFETSGLKKDLRARLLNLMISNLEKNETQRSQTQQTDNAMSSSSLAKTATSHNKAVGNTLPTMKSENEKVEVDRHRTRNEHDELTTTTLLSKEDKTEPTMAEASGLTLPSSVGANKMQGQARESISSMEVEHHNTTESESVKCDHQSLPVAAQMPSQLSSQAAKAVAPPDSSSPTTKNSSSSNPLVSKSDHKSKQMYESDLAAKEGVQETAAAVPATSSPNAFAINNCSKPQFGGIQNIGVSSLATSLLKKDCQSQPEPMAVDNVQDKKESLGGSSDLSPPASEVSACSKSSGKSVKDMVSKFSTFSSMSSNSSTSGSTLSKGLKAKMDARLARNAEIREKVSQPTGKYGKRN
jgi:SAP domain